MDLSAVVVSWNVKALLERCLAALDDACARTALDCETIVVDNASNDGSPELVQRRFPHVTLLAQSANLGFTKANNVGIAHSSGRYIILLNPDAQVLDAPLDPLVSYLDAHPDVGALGPRLLYPDGSTQPSRRRFPTLSTALVESTVLQEWFPHHPALARYYIHDRSDDEEQDVDWIVGACMIIRRQAWDQVGPLDEGFFMYSEELDWCRRLKSAGWRVVYVPWASVVHHEGQSSSQVVPARHVYFQSSKVRYFRKHYGLLVGEQLRWFLLATYVYQVCREGCKWLVGHKRPLRRERITAYLRVLRSGLQAHGEVTE